MRSLSILLCLLVMTSNLSFAKKLPIAAFASLPSLSNVSISPDGKNIASLIRFKSDTQEGSVVAVFNIKENTKRHLFITDNKDNTINSITWANNEQLLIETSTSYNRSLTKTTETRLFKLSIITEKFERIFKKKYFSRLLYLPNILSEVVDYLPDDKNHILMSVGGFKFTGEATIIKVDLKEVKQTKVVQKWKKNVFEWITDRQHNVRIAIYHLDTYYKIKLKSLDTGNYKDLWEFEAFSKDEVWPLGFALDPNILYVSALHNDRKAIFKVDLTDPNLTKELIHADEKYDVETWLEYSNINGKVTRAGKKILDKNTQKFQDSIDITFPETKNYIISLSKDEQQYVIFSQSDIEPGTYYYGDKTNNTLRVFGYKYKDLYPEKLSKKKKITYTARDGLTIEGYLTLPKGKQQTNLPTIIFPHGGPISANTDSFDYWTQFLANRGYAVLQMNFRGSYGYGFSFMKQGIGAWGKEMQTDVEDGTRWMISQGITDKNNICIVGASYGGYAALMATIKAPQLYQCVISFAGVTDLEYMMQKARDYSNYDIVKKQIGGDWSDLWQRSPLKHVSKINAPVLLIHGTNDRSVLFRHSRRMYDELSELNKNVTFVKLEKGDHYLSNNEHRLTAFTAMDDFLAKYLPIKTLTPPVASLINTTKTHK